MPRFLRRWVLTCSILLLVLQGGPLSFHDDYTVEAAESVDEHALASFQANRPNYLALENTDMRNEKTSDVIQEFSFVEKTFRTPVGQPVILRFTSNFEANEVVVRIPENGIIADTYFSAGENVRHSHGEYWILQTKKKQTNFELPVVFDTEGKYFLTIDQDADHFFLEVIASDQEMDVELHIPDKEENGTDDKKNEVEESIEVQSEEQLKIDGFMMETRPVLALEEHLNIPENLVKDEEERILEVTRDSQNRSLSRVRNWSQFRSAWNSSSTSEISLEGNINFSSSILGDSLNNRSNSVRLRALSTFSLNFLSSNNTLSMTNGDLDIVNMGDITTATTTSATTPLINLSGSSTARWGVIYSGLISYRNAPIVSLNGQSTFNLPTGRIINGRNAPVFSPIQINGNSSLVMTGGIIGSTTGTGNVLRPIESSPNSNIYIQGTHVMMTGRVLLNGIYADTSFVQSWHSADAHITGANGSIVVSSTSDPGDFSERYLFNLNNARYRTLTVGQAGGFIPPPASYTLSLQASPSEGGNPTVVTPSLTHGETTMIEANPNETFDFIRWEIISGTGSSITDPTNATTTFTMGTSDTLIQAVYQKKQGGDITVEYVDETSKKLAESDTIRGLLDEEYTTQPKEIDGYILNSLPENASGRFTEDPQTITYRYSLDILEPVLPVDPLNPDEEVKPENPPELPEDQGAISIDFVSRFTFGEQGISTQTKNYYAQPQRLLSSDGSVVEEEERPNYIQISDRRSENDRHGWQLSVTQNNQFKSTGDDELVGARLHLTNQQFATAHGGEAPLLSHENGVTLVPNHKTELVTANERQGTGTWVYRFGDGRSAGESVALEVPPTAAPKATTYHTTLTWELSAAPEND